MRRTHNTLIKKALAAKRQYILYFDGETLMMRRGKDTMTETIAIYLLAFMVLFSLVLLIVWGFSVTDISSSSFNS